MKHLLWIDMEMTGLDVEKEVIIEVAALITDLELNTLNSYHAVVNQPQTYLDQMDDWNKKTHWASGLTAQIPHGKKIEIVEHELIELIDKYYDSNEKIVIAGNSIGQDRLFIDKYLKKFASRLHYRMLDVSSFKVVFNNFYKISYAKKDSRHRAIDDINESINELKKYLSYIKV